VSDPQCFIAASATAKAAEHEIHELQKKAAQKAAENQELKSQIEERSRQSRSAAAKNEAYCKGITATYFLKKVIARCRRSTHFSFAQNEVHVCVAGRTPGPRARVPSFFDMLPLLQVDRAAATRPWRVKNVELFLRTCTCAIFALL